MSLGPTVVEPLVEELVPAPDPEAAFLRLCGLPHCLFLDGGGSPASAARTVACHDLINLTISKPDAVGLLGRYSFLAADPVAFLRQGVDDPDALGKLAAAMRSWSAPTIDGLPPFQGGAAGLFSYDLGRQLENLPQPRADEFGLPALAIGLYDVVLAWDHLSGRAWIISRDLTEPDCGFPSPRLRGEGAWVRGSRRAALAAERMAFFRRRLAQPDRALASEWPRPEPPRPVDPIPLARLSPQHPIGQRGGLWSGFSPSDYLRAVERVIAYIASGDVFQVNLAQRLLCPAANDSVSLYRRLRRCNAAPMAAYFDLGDFQVVSASPERFLRVRAGEVETRPIKGTRPRRSEPEEDEAARRELLASAKDRAENVMIVDLMRNDLGRVCRPGSVRVGEVCRLETYPFVHHLVSTVTGRLREPLGPIDLLRAAFPGGSITGAPKIRAMEIIAELEPVARGPYCGSLGYLGFDGSMDLSILIRTITAGRGWWQAPVGGGIVADSDPAREYDETWHKAEGLLRAMRGGS